MVHSKGRWLAITLPPPAQGQHSCPIKEIGKWEEDGAQQHRVQVTSTY